MEISSIGVVTPGCKACKFLKQRMRSLFDRHDIQLAFLEVDYTVEEVAAMNLCEEYGFDDIPAFEVAGVVFKKGFDSALVQEAINVIGN